MMGDFVLIEGFDTVARDIRALGACCDALAVRALPQVAIDAVLGQIIRAAPLAGHAARRRVWPGGEAIILVMATTPYAASATVEATGSHFGKLGLPHSLFISFSHPLTSGAGWKYDLLYSTHSDMSSPTIISNLSTNMYTLTGLQPGTDYYWQIKLKTATGAVVGNSAIEKFVTSGSQKPLKPVASWPIGNPTVYTLSPTLYWYLLGAGTGYKYEVEIKPGEPAVLNGTATITNISDLSYVAANLLPNTKYSWRVRSVSGSTISAGPLTIKAATSDQSDL
jgi:hypothetical protein